MNTTKDLIGDRYEIIDELGAGGQATTYLARDIEAGTEVAIKELCLDSAADWKAIELFEREGRALESVDHPSVPDYIDSFHDEGGARFFLVQEFIDGESLQERVERGEMMREKEVLAFLDEMLEVLAYLHSFSPPVIHRDIKPANILVDEFGEYALVDFGAVQVVSHDVEGGSTIVGTTGYMPPEQLMGRATPASDLYALAATAVHLLTVTHPSELSVERMKLQFRDLVGFSGPLLDVLEKMLEPEVANRFSTADEVIEALDDPSSMDRPAEIGASEREVARYHQPAPVDSPMSTVTRRGDKLIIDVDGGSRARVGLLGSFIVATLALGLTGLGCVFESLGMCCVGIPALLFGAPLAAIYSGRFAGAGKERLVLSDTTLEVFQGNFDDDASESELQSNMSIPLSELTHCYIQGASTNDMDAIAEGQPVSSNVFERRGIVFIDSKGERYTFATATVTRGKLLQFSGADTAELEWVYGCVQDYLGAAEERQRLV